MPSEDPADRSARLPGTGRPPPEPEVERLREEVRRLTEEIGFLRLQLDTLTTTDPETGLLNRNGLVEAIEMALERLDRLAEPFALTGVHLPGLPELAAADPARRSELLRHVAALLTACVRGLDRVARLDERTFAVVAPTISRRDHLVQLNRIRSVLTAATVVPEELGGRDLDVRLAVVVVEARRDRTAEEVLGMLLEALGRAGPGRPELVLSP
ncbi:MAG: hypothetical protein KatS3mg014_2584 [Actinomycetota bacterium]|nr:MAG: hypothetical protein KatS3mg014_2584 [Actinomycetota bacterium]